MTAPGLTQDRYSEFFERLMATPHSLLHDVSATLRIDIEQNGQSQRWHVTIDHGRITVTQRNAPADATMRTDPALFDQIITGEANALTAALRGRLRIDGDARMLVTFKRLLPGPPKRTTTVPENPPTQGRTDVEETA
jgi:predicted lipid carrier protein YhbT